MRHKIDTAGVLLAALLSASFALPQSRPKDHYREGQQLLKQDRVYEAYREFSEAARLDPRKEKYQRKLAVVGREASIRAGAEARQYLNASRGFNPVKARDWLQQALEYDGANAAAERDLDNLRQEMRDALQRTRDAEAALNRGDLRLAADIFGSVAPYRDVVGEVIDLEKEVSACERARAAETLWESNKEVTALEQLKSAESDAPNSVFVKTVSKRLRREISDFLVAQATAVPSDPPSNLLQRMQLVDAALDADKSDDNAAHLKTETSSTWTEAIVRRARSAPSESPVNVARVSFEMLRLAESHIAGAAPYLKAKAELESLAYPGLRVRIAIGDFANCPLVVTKETISAAVRAVLTPVARVDGGPSDLTLSVANLSCSSTEIPRETVQKVNSTFLAGHNQLVNPEYVRLQDQLSSAQQELNRATVEAQLNPNFASGFVQGIWQGRVNRLRNALSSTPAYITQEIVQQYQYEKFEAYRSYQIECALRVVATGGQRQFASERKVSFAAEDRKEGISGVLPEDRTGAQNLDPVLLPLEQYANQASLGFTKALAVAFKELVAGYFATIAADKKLAVSDRAAALLYVFDMAEGTRYEEQKRALTSTLRTALISELSGTESLQPFVESLPIPVPDQIAISTVDSQIAQEPRSILEQAVGGVVSIETDSGMIGSGFFVTPACLVVTNEHVVGDSETIVLRTAEKRLLTASILAKDSERDLALLRSNARVCTPLSVEDPAQARVGQEIYAIGNPLGLSGTVTRGIISAFRTTGNGVHYIQLDATINSGNSGGPLVNRNGRVLGVTTFKVKGYEGLNFAVASSEIRNAFSRFIQ